MATLSVASPTFQPAMRVISSITNANQAVVTTTIDHDYADGMIVRLWIPKRWGMEQANQLTGEITVTGSTTFSIGINATLYDSFFSLVNVDTTDSSGDASGTLSGYLFSLGQSFRIGDEFFYVIAASGALLSTGNGSGTFDTSTGAYTFT